MQRKRKMEIDPVPVERPDVLIYENGDRRYTYENGWSCVVRKDGTFRLKSIPPGVYFIGDPSYVTDVHVFDELVGIHPTELSCVATRHNEDNSVSVAAMLHHGVVGRFEFDLCIANRIAREISTGCDSGYIAILSEDLVEDGVRKMFPHNFVALSEPMHLYMDPIMHMIGVKSGDTKLILDVSGYLEE